jgi:hypothetical protein
MSSKGVSIWLEGDAVLDLPQGRPDVRMNGVIAELHQLTVGSNGSDATCIVQ